MTQNNESKEKKPMKNKRKKGRFLFGILSGVLFAMILLLIAGDVYLWKAQYFLEHFYENTFINGNDCGDLKVEDVKALMQERVEEYEIAITTRDKGTYAITGAQLELQYIDDYAIDVLIRKQKPLLWIQKNKETVNYEIIPKTWHDEEQMKAVVQSLPFMDQEQMIPPQNAYIEDTQDAYIIVPEVEGTTLDVDKFFEVLSQAIHQGKQELSLEEEDCYLRPEIYQDSEALQSEKDTLNRLTQADITYTALDKAYVIDRTVLKTWLQKDENGQYGIDDEKIIQFIQNLASEIDTYGGTRKFTTQAGKTITLETNEYGWKVNQEKSIEELRVAVLNGFQGDMELVYEHTANATGKDDLGNTYIEISISAQKLWYYKDGKKVLETKIVSGKESKKEYATPRNGCWVVSAKEKNYTITGPLKANGKPEYKEAAKYWVAFHGDIGIYYDKDRKKFGGTIYKKNGSYGSIQISEKTAKTIFEDVEIGTPVIVY